MRSAESLDEQEGKSSKSGIHPEVGSLAVREPSKNLLCMLTIRNLDIKDVIFSSKTSRRNSVNASLSLHFEAHARHMKAPC